MHIKTAEFLNAWARLDECRRSRLLDGDPLHMRLLGVSGLGKSFLLRRYRDASPPEKRAGRTTVPVSYVPIPCAPTVKSVYVAMLIALGIPEPKGTTEDLRQRTIALYRTCGVEICLFDEINHFVDGGRIKHRETAADALKMAVESIQLPSVFSGARRSVALYDQNMQFRSRVTSSHTLHPFSLEPCRFGELRGFISALAGALMGPDAGAHLASDEFAERIFYASDGVHRNICRLLYGVAGRGWKTPAQLGLGDLAIAFQDYLWEEASETLNPFSAKFVFRRLDRAREPYVPTEFDGDNHAPAA